jgi:putative autotransporter adhesin-like protein
MKRTSLGHHLGIGLGLGLAPCVGLALALGSAIAHADLAASQPRSVGAFHAIDLAGTLEVQVTFGKPASVTVTADGDLADQIDKVLTTVKDGVLVISTPELRRKVSHGHLRAIVTAPDLDGLSISGTGAMKVTGIANDRLAINLGGTGALTAAGSTGALRVDVGGTGEIAARDLTARDVVVDIGGTGSARLNATRSLDARVTGTGSIHVGGHPAQVKKSVSGLGSIHVER